MKQPIMPHESAESNPKAWDIYWEQIRLWELVQKDDKAKAYRKKYYAKVTEKRQIEKMKSLMLQYPAEARSFAGHNL